MDSIAKTSLFCAAMRADESKRPDRLFDDPFAHALAGEEGYAQLRIYRALPGVSLPLIEVRTRYFDERLAQATAAGTRQVVILAAGMDARAYRLPWPPGVRLFEVDVSEVLARKGAVLASAEPRCERVAVPMDLADDWPAALAAHGFDRAAPTAWLIEGLTAYIEEAAVAALLARVSELSARGSVLLFDLVGRSLLEAPVMRPLLDVLVSLGAPWRFGTDAPEALVEPLGWDATVIEPSELSARWGRSRVPPAPRGAPGVPHGYIVEATRR